MDTPPSHDAAEDAMSMDEDAYHGLMYNIMYDGNYVTVQAEAEAAAAEDAMEDAYHKLMYNVPASAEAYTAAPADLLIANKNVTVQAEAEAALVEDAMDNEDDEYYGLMYEYMFGVNKHWLVHEEAPHTVLFLNYWVSSHFWIHLTNATPV